MDKLRWTPTPFPACSGLSMRNRRWIPGIAKNAAIAAAALGLGLLLAACSMEVALTDVSSEPRFQPLIGERFEIIGPVYAYGIRHHSGAPVEYVTLLPPPGIGGYEVGFEAPLATGSVLTIAKVVKTNLVFDNGLAFIVTLEGTTLPAAVPVRVELNRGNEGNGSAELNPDIYRRVPARSR